MITYGSVCSGIESASVAWEPLGLIPSWFSEIEPFPCSLLTHHYPHVVNLGDMNVLPSLISSNIIDAPDILVGGTPCQAFSVAGKGESLDDERGQLTMKYVEVLNEIDKQRPGDECVAVWENVPGVLSTKDNAFGCFLWITLSGSECELQQSGKNGQTLVVCLDPKEQSRGGSSMPNISEWPNDADVCFLSQVLEKDSIPQKYYLSPKACAGILNRAEKRGKKLPEQLQRALEMQIEQITLCL